MQKLRLWVVTSVATVFILLGCGSSPGSKEVEGEDQVSGRWDQALAPSVVAVDDTGVAWALSQQPGAAVVRAYKDGELGAVELEAGPSSEIGAVLVSFDGGVAAIRVVCDHDPCASGSLVVDLLRAAPDVSSDRAWTVASIEDPQMPILAALNSTSMVISIGAQVYSLEADGRVDTLALTGQEGDVCVDSEGVVAVVPVVPADEFEGPFGPVGDEGDEEVALVRLDPARGSRVIPGSQTVFARSNGEEVRCVESLQIARPSQPASQIWTGTAWQTSQRQDVDWQLGEVHQTSNALVGIINNSVARVDAVTGAAIVSARAPEALVSRWAEGAGPPGHPLSYRLDINSVSRTAIACFPNGANGEDLTGTCYVF